MTNSESPASIATRRQFLRYAGGVTFLALVPNGQGLFAAPGLDAALPLFTALPYIQPGNNSALVAGRETQTIAFQTDRAPADFTLEYGSTPLYGKKAKIARMERAASASTAKYPAPAGYNYAATLPNLDLSTRYYYRLRGNGKIIADGEFTTRKGRGERTRFVSFGDNAQGSPGERAIAYHAHESRPDFILNTGDNVYRQGLNNEYIEHFFPVYNADTPDPKIGAPLLRSVPFYTVLGNHDVAFKDARGKTSLADFDQAPDALAYYTNMYLPLNGPAKPADRTPIVGADDRLKPFQKLAGPRYPRMANYSFDYGDAHFLCLDSNVYIDSSNADLQKWIGADLAATNARWKFVAYHHPAFNVGTVHYREQHMRMLSPIFEKHGVDVCLNGHEHVYQRCVPLRFQPGNIYNRTGDRRVPGTFTCDRKFNGKQNTRPEGVLYITTGAGGAGLYDRDFDNNPEKWLHSDDNNIDYVTRFISSTHSFTVFDMTANELTMTQIGEEGQTLDQIRLTKGA